MKKIFNISIITLVAILFVGCAPTSKQSYLERYDAFIEEASQMYRDCTPEDWSKMVEKFEKYSKEYYHKFESELTAKEKLKALGHEAKFIGYQSYIEMKDITKDADELINGVISDVKDYVDNDLKRDVDELKRDIESAVNELDKTLNEEL